MCQREALDHQRRGRGSSLKKKLVTKEKKGKRTTAIKTAITRSGR